jgi:DNA (cytosine-5)-methyltransferase 1
MKDDGEKSYLAAIEAKRLRGDTHYPQRKLRVLDLFSGIGGFSLGLERTGGFETVAFCEIEPFPRRVLAKHWPEVPCYHDVRELTAARLAADGIAVDVITGGFPCQDLSSAGAQAGIKGERSGLWSEIARLVSEIGPKFVIVENVAALLEGERGAWFGRVLGDLAAIGYDAEWHCIPSSAVGAPHTRDRVWIVANPKGERQPEERPVRLHQLKEWLPSRCEEFRAFADTSSERVPRSVSETLSRLPRLSRLIHVGGAEAEVHGPDLPEPLIWGSRDGIPDWVDRLKGVGNTVNPVIPELIGRAILQSRKDAA